MALSEAQIYDIATDWFVDGWAVARAAEMVEQVEAEAQKQDTALMRQLLNALRIDRIDTEDWPADSRIAIDALRARLEGKP